MGIRWETIKASGWAMWLGGVVIVTAIAFTAMSVFGFGLFQRGTADFRGETDVIEQTRANADFRIAAYNQFFDLCTSIQGTEGRIAALNTELETADEDRASQIRATLTALNGQRFESIARYNNDAAKDYTVGQFRDSALPYQLDPEEEKTVCVNG